MSESINKGDWRYYRQTARHTNKQPDTQIDKLWERERGRYTNCDILSRNSFSPKTGKCPLSDVYMHHKETRLANKHLFGFTNVALETLL